MNSTQPLVSVIIPYYNHGRHLHQAVHSALRAYSGPTEIVIVDDGSTEAKASVFLENAQTISPCVRVIKKQNGGLSSARNAGLAEAKGDFIQFLDSDDLLVPGKIDLQIDHFQIQPRIDISISNYLLCDELGTHFSRDGDPISRFSFSLSDFLFYWERGFSIPIHCGLFRRSAFKGILFDTTVAGKEDWIFWCRQAHGLRRFGYAPVYGAIYRQNALGMSKSFRSMGENWLMAAERIRQAVGCQDPRFEKDVQTWYRSFYLPRILNETEASEGQRGGIQQKSTGNVPAAIETSRMKWVRSFAARQTPPVDTPLFSVIVPVYNHYDHLAACLESIASQEVSGGVEVIIADDRSSDSRVRPLLREFARVVPNARLLLNDHNLGISATQNSAVKIATGEYVAFVDCDDALEPNALSVVAESIKPSTDYLFTDRTDMDERGEPIRVARYGGYPWLHASGDVKRDLLDAMVASHLKVIRRATYESVGGSDPRYSGVQDWELALKIADAGGEFVYIPRALYRHRLHAGSVTSSESVRQFWLSNVARRHYAVRWLGRTLADEVAMRRAALACANIVNGKPVNDREVLLLREFRVPDSVEVVKKAWRAGQICVYAPHAEATVPEMNLVREYNSYFDAIVAHDEAIGCFFLGYMWNHGALHFAGEALMSRTSEGAAWAEPASMHW
jgi:glycosyltransferase involved in cell wall biosynthesis